VTTCFEIRMTAGNIPYELLMEDKGKRKEKNHLADKY
jgi:hypothetical protein